MSDFFQFSNQMPDRPVGWGGLHTPEVAHGRNLADSRILAWSEIVR